MGALPMVDFFHDREPRARIPPEMSNFYCHPGKAGGSPMILAIRQGALRLAPAPETASIAMCRPKLLTLASRRRSHSGRRYPAPS
jgi:hypothetical protein